MEAIRKELELLEEIGLIEEKDFIRLKRLEEKVLEKLETKIGPAPTQINIPAFTVETLEEIGEKELELQKILKTLQEEKEKIKEYEKRIDLKIELRDYLRRIEWLKRNYKNFIYPDTFDSLGDMVDILKDKKTGKLELYYAFITFLETYMTDVKNHGSSPYSLLKTLNNILGLLKEAK